MRKILLVGIWMVITPTLLLVSSALFLLLPINPPGSVKGASTQNVELRTSYQLFTALTSVDTTIGETVTVDDARTEIVKQFLDQYGSPLLPHAKQIVEVSDKYHLDFRLLPAVAMQESTLCKFIPQDSYNCWGYGIYGDKVLRFSSFEEAIEKVAKGLSSDYIHDGLTTPEQIMGRYTPSSNGSWASSVRHFMEAME